MTGSTKKREDRFHRAVRIFHKHGRMLRTAEALRAGIHPDTLYALRDRGVLERMSRGLYRLAEAAPLSNPDLVCVAMRIPDAVVCLISALAFHEMTTQVPHEVHIALRPGAEEPRLEHPPIRTYRFADAAYEAGIESHRIDDVHVHIYSIEKTLADCFKFRNRIGLDVAVEALRLYRDRRKVHVPELLRCAATCRVQKVMRPYLEAIL